MQHILEQVTAFADKAHGDQQRKYAPERYIEHPKRVMHTCQSFSTSLPLLAAALLHDVLEDTPVTREEIESFLGPLLGEKETKLTMQYVVELTDRFVKSTYPNMNRRTRKAKELKRLEKISPGAQTIKYADIIDNIKAIGEMDGDFAPVYLHECRAILKKLDKGHPVLYEEAKKRVEEELQSLG